MGWEENTIKWLKDRAADCEHKDKTWLGEDTPISSGYHSTLNLIDRLRATIEAKDAEIDRLGRERNGWENSATTEAEDRRVAKDGNDAGASVSPADLEE